MADLKLLTKKRSSLKSKLTIFSNYLNLINNGSSLTQLQHLDLEERFVKFQAVYTDFDTLQSCIEELVDEPESLLSEREDFERQFFSLTALARSLLGATSKGHFASRCKLTHCKYCKTKHNTLLHLEKSNPEPLVSPLPSATDNVTLSATTMQLATSAHVLLSTAGERVRRFWREAHCAATARQW
ncbi:hypothetical protein ACJJTC_018878 [Scirpophaga incertulas]